MAVCQYFLRGQCRFGSDCRNEHPQGGRAQGGGFGNSSWTRPGGDGTGSTATTKLFSVQSIETDMNPAVDKPSWPLSSYAPAKYEPLLLPGLDQSFEELRVKATTALKEGKSNEYTQYEASTIAAAEQVFANLRANLTQAYEQALRQTAGSDPTPAPAPATSAFGTATSSTAFPSTSSAFGTTSVFGNNNAKPATSVFGTPAPAASAFGSAAPATSVFGTPAPAASAFGQPAPATSAFGTPAPATSAFGAPAPATSAFGTPAPTTSAFGQTGFGTTPASTSAFGGGATTSAFGKPAFGQPAFGQTSTPSAPATGAFGQPLNNAATTATPTAFGTPAATTTTSAFGQPAFGQSSLIKPASGAFSAFSGGGASPFAAAAAANNPTPATTTGTTGGGGGAFSAFSGQPSAFGLGATGTTTQNVFGQPAFGQPSAPAAPATSVFGTPAPAASAFGAPAQTTSVFGQPQQPAQTTSVFGQPAGGSTTAPTSVFGGTGWGGGLTANAASASTPSRVQSTTMEMNPSSASSNTPMKTAVSMGSSNSGAAGFGKPAALDFNTMKNAGVKPGMNPYDQMLPPNYAEMLPAGVLDAFKAPAFEWGNVPDWVPPLSVR